jgi:hypothetical protein
MLQLETEELESENHFRYGQGLRFSVSKKK